MKHRIIKITALLALLAVEVLVFTTAVYAYPSGWLLPMYNDGRAVISDGPGEGDHQNVDGQAIDYLSFADPWFNSRDVRAAHAGTVLFSQFDSCAGHVVWIKQTDGKSSLYFHLLSRAVTVGNSVSRGQVIGDWGGILGSCQMGAHLHFTARTGVNSSNPIYTGTPIVISNFPGTGWYPWWPELNHNSGYVVQSTSHSIISCSYDRTVDVRWPPTSWVTGGTDIDGYSWQWTTSSTTLPDMTKDGEESVTTNTSSSLAKGNWYFHMRVKDVFGNWSSSSETSHLGPYCICTTGCPTSSEE